MVDGRSYRRTISAIWRRLFTFDYFHGRYVPGFCGKDFGIFYRQTGFVEDLFNIDDGLVGIFERLKGFSRD